MKRRGPSGVLSLLLIAVVLVQGVTPAAWAGGLWLYERATPEVGTANAGVAARAEDASIAASNPAGMSRLEKPELMLGLEPIIGDVKFQPGPGTANINPRGPDGDGGVVTPAASLFYVHPLGKDWRIGFSMGSYMGLGVKYEDDWVGRYYVQESALLTANVAPTLSYRVTDWLSIGAGPVFQYAYLSNKVALNNKTVADPAAPDGRLEYKDGSFGIGGGAGILVQPWKGTRFGLTYMSPIQHEFTDTPKFSNAISPINQVMAATTGETKIKMTIPQAVMFSVYSQVNDTWTVMGNVGWQNWTQFGYTGVSVTSTATSATVSTTTNADYDDTFHIAVGVHYRFHPQWRATAGFAYDSSPAGEADRTVALPLDRQFRYSAGLIYEPNNRFTIGLAYTFIDGGSAGVNQTRGPLAGTVQGDFSANYYHVVALYAGVRF
jgi:long-chain fatty acid transport protein